MAEITIEEPASPDEPGADPNQDSQVPQDPAAQMTGYMAIKVTVDGRSRTVWQVIQGGIVQGLVDRYGRAVVLDGAFEAKVVDGLLLDSLAAKGGEA